MSDTVPTPDASGPSTVIDLPERVEMRTVGVLSDALRRAEGPVSLRAGAVTLVTSPGAQLLVAAAREGRGIAVTDASGPFHDCLTMLGVDPATLTPREWDA